MICLSRCIHKIISILGQYPPQGYIHPIINNTICHDCTYSKIFIQMLIRKFKSDPHMKTNLSDSKVVLDPDLIDLTMIPPPMTPDEEGPARIFPGTASAVSTPPTPFADRQSLEAELQVISHSYVALHKISSRSFQYVSLVGNIWNCPDVITLVEHSLSIWSQPQSS